MPQPAWIAVDGVWHILVRVDASGWRSACGLTVNGDAQVLDDAPPEAERKCPRCLDLERDPKP